MMLSIPFGIPRAIYLALQKGYLIAPWVISGSAIGLLFFTFFLHQRFSFVWISAALPIGSFLGLLFSTIWFQLKHRVISFNIQSIKVNALKRLFKPSREFLILQITALVIYQSDTFLVNFLLGQEACGTYSLHFQAFFYFQLLVQLIIDPLWASLGNAHHQQDLTWFKNTITRVTLLIFSLSCCFNISLSIFGPYIFKLWSHGHIAWQPKLGHTLMLFSLIVNITNFWGIALYSLKESRYMMFTMIFYATLNIIFSILFIKLFGITGAALGSLVSCLLAPSWLTPTKLFKYLRYTQKNSRTLLNAVRE